MIKEIYDSIDGLTATFNHQRPNIINHINDTGDRFDKVLSAAQNDITTQAVVNAQENRKAGHYYKRKSIEAIVELLDKMADFKDRVISDKITRVINIGVGGSDLGAKMTIEALSNSNIEFTFVSGLDGYEINKAFSKIESADELEKTLIIVSSKTFSTYETINNFKIAFKKVAMIVDNPIDHFIAITASLDNAIDNGFPKSRCLIMDEDIGGRYSICSEMGFPLYLAIGHQDFFLFMNGMKDSDDHFLSKSFYENVPALMAAIDYENNSPVFCILTYSSRMKYFVEYIQQLSMESLGKHVMLTSMKPPVIFGGVGTNAQHSYMQYLHQYGLAHDGIPVDFISPVEAPEPESKLSLSHCLAQHDLLHQGSMSKSLDYHHFGNRPSSLFLIDALTPRTLGILISIYENKTFIQSRLYNINAFNQPGVEKGKILSHQFCNIMLDKPVDTRALKAYAPSITTKKIIERIKNGNK